MPSWKIGDLARETGLTVRTLHHYDEIGLLRPGQRTESGYRLYGEPDLRRLLRIMALRQLGLSLDEVREVIDTPAGSLEGVLDRRLQRLREDIARQQELQRLLTGMADRLRRADDVEAEQLLQLIGRMKMHEKYYTPEERARIAERRTTVGEARIREVEQEWPALIAAVRDHMARGTDVTDPAVQALVRRWKALVEEFTGGDPGISRGLRDMYANEPAVREHTGIDMEMFAYVGRAMKAGSA
jgi:DNA-binding transcriptional MerR regulator